MIIPLVALLLPGCRQGSNKLLAADEGSSNDFTLSTYLKSDDQASERFETVDVRRAVEGRVITVTLDSLDLVTRTHRYEDFILEEKNGNVSHIWHQIWQKPFGLVGEETTEEPAQPGNLTDIWAIDSDAESVAYADGFSHGAQETLAQSLSRLGMAMGSFDDHRVQALKREIDGLGVDLRTLSVQQDLSQFGSSLQASSSQITLEDVLKQLPTQESYVAEVGMFKRRYNVAIATSAGPFPALTITQVRVDKGLSDSDHVTKFILELKDPITLHWSVSVNDSAFIGSTHQLQHHAPGNSAFITPTGNREDHFFYIRRDIRNAQILLTQSPGSSYAPLLAYFNRYLDSVVAGVTVAEIASKHDATAMDWETTPSSTSDQTERPDAGVDAAQAEAGVTNSDQSGKQRGR